MFFTCILDASDFNIKILMLIAIAQVEPYKESKANGSMAEELADVLMEARAKGIAHSYKGSASASKFSAPSKKAKKGNCSANLDFFSQASLDPF